MIKDQLVTEKYAIYNGDCMAVIANMPDRSIDLCVNSPPFGGLYSYSSDPHDFSNCDTREQFLEQYDFLIQQMARITKPGRINAIHCQDVFDHASRLWDLPHEIIRIHEKHGFTYRNRITVWKEPLRVRTRTMVQSLMHKFIVEDSTRCFTAMPDYVLIFTRNGENEVPVTHPEGFKRYFGSTPILPEMLRIFNNTNETKFNQDELWEYLKNNYADHKDPRSNKLSHYIWQRYASSVWDDVRIDNVLPFRDSKEEDDEKHVHPLQLDVIDRLVEMYSNPGEVCFTPFMGVGSEVYSPVSLGRFGIGAELKDSYFKQAKLNLAQAENRFSAENLEKQASFLDDIESGEM